MADRSERVRSLMGLVERETRRWPEDKLAALVEEPAAVAAALGSAAEVLRLGTHRDGADPDVDTEDDPEDAAGTARRRRLGIERLKERWRERSEGSAGTLAGRELAALLGPPGGPDDSAPEG